MRSRAREVALFGGLLAVSATAWTLLIFLDRASSDLSTHAHTPTLDRISWLELGLMVPAMMSPALVTPIAHIHSLTFASRWVRSTLAFVGGYAIAWTLACLLLVVASATLVSVFGPGQLTLVVASLVGLVWQCSPLKQTCLNSCHALPPLPAFGAAADLGASRFGLTYGWWCANSCWPLMLMPMVLPAWHASAMAAGALLVFSERLEHPARPCWRWRVSGKLGRSALAHLRLGSQRGPAWNLRRSLGARPGCSRD